MPAKKKTTSKSKVTVKDLKTRKNPKGGAVDMRASPVLSTAFKVADGSVAKVRYN